jgi:mannose-6-phosphate isomerase-like protein (cupin superfamily)
MKQGQPVRDASHLYEVERRARHAERPGFHITELQLSPTQKVPWHTHTNISDTFYVLEGQMRLFLQDPKEEVNLKPGEVYAVRPIRPHLVTNGGTKSLTFLVPAGGRRIRLRAASAGLERDEFQLNRLRGGFGLTSPRLRGEA